MEPEVDDTGFLFYCPDCGIELERSNYDTPEPDYSCPLCGTSSMPSAVPVA